MLVYELDTGRSVVTDKHAFTTLDTHDDTVIFAHNNRTLHAFISVALDTTQPVAPCSQPMIANAAYVRSRPLGSARYALGVIRPLGSGAHGPLFVTRSESDMYLIK